MKALVVEPGKAPKKVEIADKLSTLQEIANCATDRTVLRSKTDAERNERTP